MEFDSEILKNIQETLFVIGSQLASDPSTPPKSIPEFGEEEIEKLEIEIDKMESKLPVLRHFILPGGHYSISYVHITRNVCRRAERLVVSLKDIIRERPLIIMYLNRLSDFLFVLSRYWTEILGVPEYKWIPSTRS
jgi:cob(I)alamin adenosyltransferase